MKYTYNGDLNLNGAVDGNAATIFSTFNDNGATSGNTYASPHADQVIFRNTEKAVS